MHRLSMQYGEIAENAKNTGVRLYSFQQSEVHARRLVLTAKACVTASNRLGYIRTNTCFRARIVLASPTLPFPSGQTRS